MLETKDDREGTMGLLSKNVLNRIMMIGNLSHLRIRLSTASSIQHTPGEKLGLGKSPAILDGSGLEA